MSIGESVSLHALVRNIPPAAKNIQPTSAPRSPLTAHRVPASNSCNRLTYVCVGEFLRDIESIPFFPFFVSRIIEGDFEQSYTAELAIPDTSP